MDTRILIATPGMVLTNGETYSTEVYLGCNDSPENWREIKQEEINIIFSDQEETEGEEI